MSCDGDYDACINSGEDLVIPWEQRDANGDPEPGVGDSYIVSIRKKGEDTNVFQFSSGSGNPSDVIFTPGLADVIATYAGVDTASLVPGVYDYQVFYSRDSSDLIIGEILVSQGFR